MKINFRLRELRLEKGITQKELAKDFNVTQAKISRWENRVYDPSLDYIIKFAAYFNVTMDYLLGLVDGKHEYIMSKKK